MQAVIRLIRRRAVSVYAGGIFLSLWAPVACGDGDSISTSGQAGGGGDAGAGAGGEPESAGTGGNSSCPTIQFVSPQNGASLTQADDIGAGAGADSCSNGFQYNVKVFTSAVDGTQATLFSGSNRVATASVTGGFATFTSTQLSIGSDVLRVQVGSDACSPAVANVTVSCNGAPTCDISKPVVSATHPDLNGVPVKLGGDRASAAGSPYQVAFEVTTSIADGSPVNLQVNSSSELITALASGGVAKFAGVPLSPDGEFSVVASCHDASGKTSQSGVAKFTVDTTAPDLSVTEPVAGKHFGPTEDSDTTTAGQQFQVCGATQASDAVDLPDNLGATRNNFCVGLGTATPVCVPATGNAAPCVNLTCQDRVPFDLNITLGDEAGNIAQATVKGISCTSTLPGISIVDPVDGTGTDNTTHILAATADSGRKDSDGVKAGAQFTVVACTDVANASMTLMGAVKGQAAQVLATTTSSAAVPGDNCPAGKSYVGKFVAATLPESEEGILGALVNPTELTVTVSDQGTTGTSPAVDVWVDSVAPSINQLIPNPLCGSLIRSTVAVSKSVTLLTSAVPVLASVTNGGTTTPYTASTADIGQAVLSQVNFGLGENTFVATATDPAGNTGALLSPCIVTVGNPPIVTWSSPVGNLNIANDGDGATAGWQGTLSVQTDLAGTGATVQFSTAAGDLGAPVSIDGSGKATSPVLTIADAASVTLTATTSDVPGRGVGTAKQTVVVDTLAPSAIADLAATVPAALRRQTTFHLAWTAPDDHGSAVSTYDVRIAKGVAITAGNFDAQERIAYAAAPSAPGIADGLDASNRMIENDYYFAAAAIDKGGNRGPIVSSGPTAAHFNSTILSSGVVGEMFGYTVDGSTSLNGDAYSDLVVGAYNSKTVYIYMGAAAGYPSTATSKIVGSTLGFGQSATVVGDIDSDGLPDLAIGSPNEGNGGMVYIFKGRAPWPASLQQSNADYVVQTVGTGFSGALNGSSITRLGDFNGDGVDDFGIGAPGYNGGAGRVSVILGVGAGKPFGTAGTVSLPTDYVTKAVQVDAPAAAGFGAHLIGLGHFYPGGGSTLVGAIPASAGAALAYHGIAGGAAMTTPDQTFAGPVTNGRASIGLALLGSSGALPVVGVGSPAYRTNAGRVDLFAGDTAAGPFSGAHAIYTDSRASAVGDGFGVMVVGSAFVTGAPTSFLGDSSPDVVVGAFHEAGAAPHVYFMTGQNAITVGTRDIVTAADASVLMPADWQGCSLFSGPIRDLNSDSYGDIAIGEWQTTFGYNGRVVVLW